MPPAASGPKPLRADAHLRSTLAVTGYHLQATDGIVGHISDFLVDDKSWAIGELVIKVGHRFTGKEVRIPAGQVAEISYDSSKVHVKLSTDAVERSPAWLNGSTPPESGNSKKPVESILAP
ncbi:MAG TPA: PRC-barrel domain-containing protein [Candidatus Angelobacter sp.]|nr:PRC-barrel domain-containing protein [Candidatus Angelobacter sp.]